MILKIEPSTLQGNIVVPPSKSDSHRALICSALASYCAWRFSSKPHKPLQKIKNILFSEDIKATINAMSCLGIDFRASNEEKSMEGAIGSQVCTVEIQKSENAESLENIQIDCNESGSTLRFIIPIFAALGIGATFIGKGKLPERPLSSYIDTMSDKGICFERHGENYLPLTISGKLSGGEFCIDGNISSQFISGLLFALPLLEKDSVIKISGRFESKPYVDMTVDSLKKFGIEISYSSNTCCGEYYIKGRQAYCEVDDYIVEGDCSQAAFYAVAAAISGNQNPLLKISGLKKNTKQGDFTVFDIVERCGANVKFRDEDMNCESSIEISGFLNKPFDFDVSDTPDLVPALAVLAACCPGTSHIYGAARLRIKESDRLYAITECLRHMGINIKCDYDSLAVSGGSGFSGGEVYSHNDHRIAMAVAVAALKCNPTVILHGAESVNKSYPGFWNDYKLLGGRFDVLNLDE